jgi:hypothetical protein
MIILEKHRPRVLMPIARSAWSPSAYVPKDQFGNDTTRHQFSAAIRLNDGHIAWRGVFQDREDFDAFLWAHVTGSLRYDRALWRLPTPQWIPGLYDDLVLEFATDVFLTTTGTSNTYTVPSDWNSSSNTIHCVAAGGGGACARWASGGSPRYAAGPGGGGYGRGTNVTLTPSGSATYGIGAGGAGAATRSTDGFTNGSAGGDTYFDAASYAAASFGGTGGAGGVGSNTAATLAGSAGGSGKGAASASGGNGGDINSTTNTRYSTGGGGAGGPSGNGGQGNSIASGSNVNTTGGTGNGGGVAGNTAGTLWNVSPAYGPGGGATSAQNAGTNTGGAGPTYGGGGGSAVTTSGNTTGGTGAQGIIYISYTPGVTSFFPNLAMMGM